MIVVYTALLDSEVDQLRPPVVASPNVRFQAYVDDPRDRTHNGWELRESFTDSQSGRRCARYHKCLSHWLYPQAHYTVWVDATHQPLVDMFAWTSQVTGGFKADFCTYKHRERTCIYQEGRACLRLQKDRPELITEQLRRYAAAGYPAYHGLCETGVVVRKHTRSVETLNTRWWQEIDEGSVRDQISLPFVLWRLRRSYTRLPGFQFTEPQGFRYHPHAQPCASAST